MANAWFQIEKVLREAGDLPPPVPGRGSRHTCWNCGTAFYDNYQLPVCPKCQKSQKDPEAAAAKLKNTASQSTKNQRVGKKGTAEQILDTDTKSERSKPKITFGEWEEKYQEMFNHVLDQLPEGSPAHTTMMKSAEAQLHSIAFLQNAYDQGLTYDKFILGQFAKDRDISPKINAIRTGMARDIQTAIFRQEQGVEADERSMVPTMDEEQLLFNTTRHRRNGPPGEGLDFDAWQHPIEKFRNRLGTSGAARREWDKMDTPEGRRSAWEKNTPYDVYIAGITGKKSKGNDTRHFLYSNYYGAFTKEMKQHMMAIVALPGETPIDPREWDRRRPQLLRKIRAMRAPRASGKPWDEPEKRRFPSLFDFFQGTMPDTLRNVE